MNDDLLFLEAFQWLFWISAGLVIYPYLIYPLILIIANWILPSKSSNKTLHSRDVRVSMIISAFNEESSIGRKLENALSTDYPESALEFIVVSDGSTDATEKIVSEYVRRDSRVRLISIDTQSGKSAGLNQAVPLATGDLIVFSDANSIYNPDAVRKMVLAFEQADVGYVVGSALYQDEVEDAVKVSEGLYWKYELWIKSLESKFFSVVGGDGAIYAIRKSLFSPLSTTDISDFVNPLQIVAAGYRGVFLPQARSYEGGSAHFQEEFKRKRRIVNRSWGAVRQHIGIFSAKRDKKFVFMLVSHKVVRWYSCLFVALAFFTSMILALETDSIVYWLAFGGILTTLVTGLLGWMLDKRGLDMPKLVYLIYYFYLVGTAGMLGIFDNLSGKTYATWTHGR